MDKDRYIICYDVPDDLRRAKLARVLDGFGMRVQFSVFELALSQKLFDIVTQRIREVIDPAEDKVTVYRICAACLKKRMFLGRRPEEDVDDEFVFIA